MKKIFRGTFSVNIHVTAYDEEEALDKLYVEFEDSLSKGELVFDDYVLHENDIEEVDCYD